MRAGTLIAKDSGSALAAVRRCEGSLERMRGLLWRPALAPGQGLLIAPCNSVHTFGMRYAIDVVFLDREGRVLKVHAALRPFRMAMARGARQVIELAAGEASRLGLIPQRVVRWQEGAPA